MVLSDLSARTGTRVLRFLIGEFLCLALWRRGKGQDKAVYMLVPEKKEHGLVVVHSCGNPP